jgi:hypothetical protein
MKEDPTRDPASEARDDWEQLCQPLTDEERRENARKIAELSVPDRFALMFRHASEPRETPETDAATLNKWQDSCPLQVVPKLLAVALERQRDEAREHAANAEASLKMAINSANARQTETEHAMRQRDELLEMLESLLQHRPRADWEGLTIAEGLTWDDAEDLIAAVKGGTP